MQAKTPYPERVRRKQAMYLTVTAGVLSVALTVAVIVYCYHSTHLHF